MIGPHSLATPLPRPLQEGETPRLPEQRAARCPRKPEGNWSQFLGSLAKSKDQGVPMGSFKGDIDIWV